LLRGLPHEEVRQQLKKLPWREIPMQNRTTTTGHGRRLKVCAIQTGLLFREDASRVRTGTAPRAGLT
jgi:hypothetical protein